MCLQVNVDKEVHIPLVNSTNSRVSLKVGTLIGTYNTIDERDLSSPVPNCRTVKIRNDLIPESIQSVPGQGSREKS